MSKKNKEKNSKEHNSCKKDYIWNPATCSCKTDKDLASIIDDSVIICDETIDAVTESYGEKTKRTATKTVPAKSY